MSSPRKLPPTPNATSPYSRRPPASKAIPVNASPPPRPIATSLPDRAHKSPKPIPRAAFPTNKPPERKQSLPNLDLPLTEEEAPPSSPSTPTHNTKNTKLQSIITKFGISKTKGSPKNTPQLSNSKTKFTDWLLTYSREGIALDDMPSYFLDDKHISWLVGFIVDDKKLERKVAAAKFLCSLAWPNEIQGELRSKIVFSGLLPYILELGKAGHLSFHHHIEESEVEITGFIAKGAGGKVHKGIFQDKPVAIKYCGESSVFYGSIEDFRFEVAAMSLLTHHNVLPCYGANEKCPTPFIVLPLQEQSLDHLFKSDKDLRIDIKVKIALQVADAMNYLHDCKILHRDLKPSNVLLDFQYNVSICDFGISRVHDTKRPMTLNVGTTQWIAPEIFTGDGKYTPMVDIYSYGIIMYQLFTGKVPFSEFKLYEIPDRVLAGEKPTIPDSLHPTLGNLISACLEHNPKNRPIYATIESTLLNYLKEVQPSTKDRVKKKK